MVLAFVSLRETKMGSFTHFIAECLPKDVETETTTYTDVEKELPI